MSIKTRISIAERKVKDTVNQQQALDDLNAIFDKAMGNDFSTFGEDFEAWRERYVK
jgi:hypothetical protein